MSPRAQSQSLSFEDAPRLDVAQPDTGSAAGAVSHLLKKGKSGSNPLVGPAVGGPLAQDALAHP